MFQDPGTFCQLSLHYLVVGGGTAGLAVAARLSEDPEVNVGVIEAGPSALNGEDGGAITVPDRYGETIGSKYDWQFETVPQPGLGGRSLKWPRGRVLGGTSALNFMAWNRGHREDYDAWAQLGNKGWGWEDLLPYFQRSETFHQPSAAHQEHYHSSYDAEFHGTDGPLHTTHVKQYGPAHQFWHATLNELGVASNEDSLAGSNCGAWNMVCTIDPQSQQRSYSASAYYAPIAERKNLHVLTNATVLNVIIEKVDGEWSATGVKVRRGENEKNVKAVREVILCAGSIQSPQLLELSGIGQREVLEAAGIDVKIENSNVGENLQDHMSMATSDIAKQRKDSTLSTLTSYLVTATIFEVLPSLSTRDDILNDTVLREAADRAYYASQTGPWTVLPCSVAYCPLARVASQAERAQLHMDAQNIAQETGRLQDKLLVEQFDSAKDMRGQLEYIFDLGNWSTYFPSEPGKKYGTLLQILQYPFSRGSIHIPPRNDPSHQSTVDNKPIIDPQYYLGPGSIDREVMALGQRMAKRICQTEPLAKIIIRQVFPPLPDESILEQKVYEDFVSSYTVTDWHPVGTCAMGGSKGAKVGVVDERLRVYGVRGLRVIDASIMPLQVGAHIQATVYAIAEKGAAMIREDWSGSS